MPYFYFHAYAGGCLIEDLDGGDLPDLDTARAMAVLALRQYAAIAAGAGLRLGGREGSTDGDHGRARPVAVRDAHRRPRRAAL